LPATIAQATSASRTEPERLGRPARRSWWRISQAARRSAQANEAPARCANYGPRRLRLTETPRKPSFLEVRRSRYTRRDTIEICLTIFAALVFSTALIWLWP
jgi:hypothetical protein